MTERSVLFQFTQEKKREPDQNCLTSSSSNVADVKVLHEIGTWHRHVHPENGLYSGAGRLTP